MSNLLATLQEQGEIEFLSLFTVEEGRAGCVVSFLAMLELCKESLIEIIQSEPFAPIFLRPSSAEPGSLEKEQVNFNQDSEADSVKDADADYA